MKKYLYTVPAALLALSSGALFAQEGSVTAQAVTVPTLIDTTSMQNSLLTQLQSWLVIGLAVGIGVFVVYAGWRILRRFTR